MMTLPPLHFVKSFLSYRWKRLQQTGAYFFLFWHIAPHHTFSYTSLPQIGCWGGHAMASSSTSDKAEALRLKERELTKREELIRRQQEALAAQRSSFQQDLLLFEARVAVMTEAEAQHGSLLAREQDATKTQAELKEREKHMSEEHATMRERLRTLEGQLLKRQAEFEDKMLPLAAREQELLRREAEMKHLEGELDQKQRAFAKKLHLEEERDRQREKQNREQETRAKEVMAKIEQRQGDTDQALQLLNDKHRQIKAEQVELETRDRDVKWRDEQLRAAFSEVSAIKTRLVKWEAELHMAQEALETKKAEMALQQHEHLAKEMTLTDRVAKVLEAERELSAREAAIEKDQGRVDTVAQAVQEKHSSTEKALSDAETLRTDLRAAREALDREREAAANKEAALTRRQTKVEEKEKAVQQWAAEVQFREAQVTKKEAELLGDGGRGAGAGGGAGSGAALLRRSAGAGHGLNGNGPAPVSRGMVQVQLRRVQDSYIGATAKPMSMVTSSNGVIPKLVATDYDAAELEEREMDLDDSVADLSSEFTLAVARFYALSESDVKTVFAADEISFLKRVAADEDVRQSELRFLSDVFCIGGHQPSPHQGPGSKAPHGGSGGGKVGGSAALPYVLDFVSLVQWKKWFNDAKDVVRNRRRTVQAQRLAELSQVVETMSRKEQHPDFAKYFSTGLRHSVVVSEDDENKTDGAAASTGDVPATTSATRHKPRRVKTSAAVSSPRQVESKH